MHFIYLDEYWVCYDRLADLLAAKLKCYQASWIYMRDTDGYEECADRAHVLLSRQNTIPAAQRSCVTAHP